MEVRRCGDVGYRLNAGRLQDDIQDLIKSHDLDATDVVTALYTELFRAAAKLDPANKEIFLYRIAYAPEFLRQIENLEEG